MENGHSQILMYMCIKVKPLINDHLYKTTSLQRLHSNLGFKMTKAYFVTETTSVQDFLFAKTTGY